MNVRLLAISAWLTVGLAAGGAIGQVPQPLEVSAQTMAVTGDLTDAQKAEVDGFLTNIAEKMAGAVDPQGKVNHQVVAAVRDFFAKAYGEESGAGYKRYFAQSAQKNFSPVTLASKHPLILVSASLLLSRLQQPEIGPALDDMVGHKNAAVRYWGLATYAKIRDDVLFLGPDSQDRLLATLRARAQVETSAVVLRALFNAVDFSKSKATAAILQRVRPEARKIFVEAGRRNLLQIRLGNPGMCMAYSHAAATAEAMAKAIPSPTGRDAAKAKEQRGILLQMLADVMANAGQAYLELHSEPESTKQMLRPVGQLLTDCEEAIEQVAEIKGTSRSPVAEAMRATTSQRANRVMLAVNGWVGTADGTGILDKYGVAPPKVLEREDQGQEQPTTQPTTP